MFKAVSEAGLPTYVLPEYTMFSLIVEDWENGNYRCLQDALDDTIYEVRELYNDPDFDPEVSGAYNERLLAEALHSADPKRFPNLG
jgi:hypothetical protein